MSNGWGNAGPWALWAALAMAPSGFAEDRVVLQPGGPFSSRIVVRGEIEDYTGKLLTIRLKVGAPTKSYPAQEVLEVETVRSPAYQRGAQLFEAHEAARALMELQNALALEERTWVRREILALMVRCGLYGGDYPSAGRLFLVLLESDPTTRHFQLIPLAWAAQDLIPDLRNAAEGWLRSEAEAARLMGASFLAEDPRRQEVALSELKSLCTSTDRRVRELAQAQVWRSRLKTTEVGRTELQRWQVRIEEMQPELRGGPYFLLGRAYLLRREHELAAACFLWVPLVYDADRFLSARACLRAADALATIGQKDAASALYVEITQKYADTPFGQEALQLLQPSAAP